jgi:hypothetical protein
MGSSLSFEFTNSWFESSARSTWDQLIPQLKPKRILEIGSYEGASTCYLIDKLGRLWKTRAIRAKIHA